MKNICEKYISKIKKDNIKLCFKYNGNLIKESSKFEEEINEIEKNSYVLNIIEEEKKRETNENNLYSKEKINKGKINNIKNNSINYKINENCIIANINIEDCQINKDLRIINSYEENKKKLFFWVI